MALFKTAEEFNKIINIDKGILLPALLPHIEDAEEQWIVPAISQEQYDLLHTDYQDAADPPNDMVPALYALLLKVQKSLAHLAMTHMIYKDNLQKNQGGMQMKSSEHSKAAWQWMVDDANWAYAQTGFRRLDSVLTYMEENKANYAAWVGSDAYTVSKSFYINTTKRFHQIYHISESRRLFTKLWPTMRLVEKQIISDAIGEDFHNELKAAIAGGTADADQQVIIEKIQEAIGHFSIHHGLTNLFVDINERGLQLIGTGDIGQNSRKADPVRDSLLGKLIRDAKTYGENYLKQTVDYLQKTASASKYATFFNSDIYIDPTAEDESASDSENSTIVI